MIPKLNKTFFMIGLILSCWSQISAQNDLYYFMSADSLVGVKDGKGKIIIPAKHSNSTVDFPTSKVKFSKFDPLIYFLRPENDPLFNVEPNAHWIAYNKKGHFLFSIFTHESGMDIIKEGYRRYVENGKTGFVNRAGEIAITAKYDYVTPFNYGYAQYCNGCIKRFQRSIDYEIIKGGTWGVINYRGEEIKPDNDSLSGILIGDKYYPNPFQNSEQEKYDISRFQSDSDLESILIQRYNLSSKDVKFEIVEKPSDIFPYYQINLFKPDWTLLPDFSILISKNGSAFIDEYTELIPYQEWINKNSIK